MDKKTLKLCLKAVALAMGVSTLVLTIIGSVNANSAIALLSIGVICLGMLQFQEK
jgi:hypothetical protein